MKNEQGNKLSRREAGADEKDADENGTEETTGEKIAGKQGQAADVPAGFCLYPSFFLWSHVRTGPCLQRFQYRIGHLGQPLGGMEAFPGISVQCLIAAGIGQHAENQSAASGIRISGADHTGLAFE